MCVSTGLLDRFDADWDLRLCVVRFEQSRQPRAQGKFTCRLVELSKWTNVMSRTAALRWALSTLGGTSHRYVYAHQRAQYAHTPRRAKPVCPLAFQRSMCASSTAIGAASEIDALPSNWKGDLRSIGLAVFQRYAPKTNKNKKNIWDEKIIPEPALRSSLSAFPCRVTFLIAQCPVRAREGERWYERRRRISRFLRVQLSGTQGLHVVPSPSWSFCVQDFSLPFGELCFSSLQLLGQTTFPLALWVCVFVWEGGNLEWLPLRFEEHITNVA